MSFCVINRSSSTDDVFGAYILDEVVQYCDCFQSKINIEDVLLGIPPKTVGSHRTSRRLAFSSCNSTMDSPNGIFAGLLPHLDSLSLHMRLFFVVKETVGYR